jgi:hypothetical protein
VVTTSARFEPGEYDEREELRGLVTSTLASEQGNDGGDSVCVGEGERPHVKWLGRL